MNYFRKMWATDSGRARILKTQLVAVAVIPNALTAFGYGEIGLAILGLAGIHALHFEYQRRKNRKLNRAGELQ